MINKNSKGGYSVGRAWLACSVVVSYAPDELLSYHLVHSPLSMVLRGPQQLPIF